MQLQSISDKLVHTHEIGNIFVDVMCELVRCCFCDEAYFSVIFINV